MVLVSAFLGGTPGARARQTEDLGAARAAAEQAITAFRSGRYDEAAQHYERAYHFVKEPSLLFKMAESFQLLGKLEKALVAFRDYLRAAPKDAPERSQAEKRAQEIEQALAASAKRQQATTPASAPAPPPPTPATVLSATPIYTPRQPLTVLTVPQPAPSAAPVPLANPSGMGTAQFPALPETATTAPATPQPIYDPAAGAPFPGTIRERHKNGFVKSGILSTHATIQGNAFTAGTRVWFHPKGRLEKAVLSADAILQGDIYRSGTTFVFYDRGEIEKVSLSADTVIQGVLYEQYRRERANVVGFYKNGRVKEGRLAIGTTVQGIKLKAGTFVKYHENGGLSYGTLFAETLLQGMSCLGGEPVFFSETGAWVGGTGCRKVR